MQLPKKIQFQLLRQQLNKIQMQIKQSQQLFTHDFIIDNKTQNAVNVTITLNDLEPQNQKVQMTTSMIRVPHNTTIVHQLSQVIHQNGQEMSQLQKVKSELLKNMNKTYSSRKYSSKEYNTNNNKEAFKQIISQFQPNEMNRNCQSEKQSQIQKQNDNISKMIKINQSKYNDRGMFFQRNEAKNQQNYTTTQPIDKFEQESQELNRKKIKNQENDRSNKAQKSFIQDIEQLQRKQYIQFLKNENEYLLAQISLLKQSQKSDKINEKQSLYSTIKTQGKTSFIKQVIQAQQQDNFDQKIQQQNKRNNDEEEYRPKNIQKYVFTPNKKDIQILIQDDPDFNQKTQTIRNENQRQRHETYDKIMLPYSMQGETSKSSKKRYDEQEGQKSPEVYNYLEQRIKEYQQTLSPQQQKTFTQFTLSSFSKDIHTFRKPQQAPPTQSKGKEKETEPQIDFNFTPIKLSFKEQKSYAQLSKQKRIFTLNKQIQRQVRRIDKFKQNSPPKPQRSISKQNHSIKYRAKTQYNLIDKMKREQEVKMLESKMIQEIRNLEKKIDKKSINQTRQEELLNQRKQRTDDRKQKSPVKTFQSINKDKWNKHFKTAAEKSEDLFLKRKQQILSKLQAQIRLSKQKTGYRQRSKSHSEVSKTFKTQIPSKRSISPKIKQISQRLYNGIGKEPCPHQKRFNSYYYRQKFQFMINSNSMVNRNTTSQQKEYLYNELSKDKDSISFWPMKIVNYTLDKLSKMREEKSKLVK